MWPGWCCAVLDQEQVTACLVTRGDVDLQPILDSLIFDKVIVWDNSISPDWKVAGRYMVALEAETRLVYWQDDDTIVPQETQEGLLRDYFGEACLANWGHGENPDGYDDLPLVCGGAIADKRAAWEAIAIYGAEHPLDDAFKYECDFIVGVLYKDWRHVWLPFEIRDVAYNGKRLADEPWQRDLKLAMTDRARAIRDREQVAA
jgi:hypothetical protein